MESKYRIAQVVVNQNSFQTDRLFDYAIPPYLLGEVTIGMRVIVPFGKGNKRLEAYVLNIKEESERIEGLKEILSIVDYRPLLNEKQIKLVRWMKNKYLCKYVEAIQCILPKTMIKKEKKIIHLTAMATDQFVQENLEKRRGAILEKLSGLGGEANIEKLKKELPFSNLNTLLNDLEREGLVTFVYELVSKVNVKTEEYVQLAFPQDEYDQRIKALKNAKKQQGLLAYIQQNQKVSVNETLKALHTTRAVLKGLIDKGLVSVVNEEQKRNPFEHIDIIPFPRFEPTEEQKNAIEEISQAIDHERPAHYLLHGITGSGKTEIYLQLIEKVTGKGKQGIVLVPEIALTPQTVERFRGRFGDRIAVLHSNLSDGERFDEWRKIFQREVDIVIGARSAVFAPFPNVGIIIVDEEHEQTYKSEQNPKYHATEVALYRSKLEGAVVLLGSATPSVETYSKTQIGSMKRITLSKRATKAPLPKVEIVDMRNELSEGNKSMISRPLYEAIGESLQAQKQIILFLNRRGYSTFVSCRECGHVIKCDRCDIAMTFHMDQTQLHCHYCGEKKVAPRSCPSCSSGYIKYFGAGTQKLEKVIASRFPTARIVRMDMDSTARKGAHQQILDRFKKGEVDILIGTQMISKGLDFPNVTLVGIISIDSTLNLPDFRASEKAFQLITQVAGRAGRGYEEGRVILQTYEPEHYSILTASEHDYYEFIQQEIPIRREFLYPPFIKLISLNFSGSEEEEVYSISKKIANNIKYILTSKGYEHVDEVVLGPNTGLIAKINQKYRYQILLKDFQIEQGLLKGIIKHLLIDHRQKAIPQSINLSIDIDPYTIM